MNYDYWHSALADPAALKARELRITTDVQLGFYRTKSNQAVAIWIADGDDYASMAVDGEEIPLEKQEKYWLSCATRPISEDWYRLVVDQGGNWPDLDEAVSGIGHNRKVGDEPGNLIDDLAEAALAYAEINDDEEAARAISLRAALLELHKVVDKQREAEKAPHLRAAKAVDEEWMHIVKKAKACADRLRDLVAGWESRKRFLARQAELEKVGIQGTAPAPSEQIRSGYGKAVSVRERTVVTAITDYRALIDHLWKTRPEELGAILRTAAQKDVDIGLDVPGIRTEIQAVVR